MCILMLKSDFVVITIDNASYWKNSSDQLIPKLRTACYAVRTIKSLMSENILIMVDSACFHSVMSYGVVFWGNSPYSSKIFYCKKES
jgi:hypothetical protein